MVNKNFIQLKSITDRIAAIFLFVTLIPLNLLIALTIYVSDGKPIFFVQKRIGLYKKLFTLYKYRTMTLNSSSKVDYYTREGDPRITPLGLILRKFSLDELPQLINIIKGDMSFIGPRPPVHDELDHEKLSPEVEALLENRFLVKPGISGMAQVYGRNSNNWSQKIVLDSKYVKLINKNIFKCIKLDILLVLLTIKEILFTSGEYDN
tara:strand:+ start:252 stop:872 length:621 start_codon:yes stop_codon:yes gene_type:complete